MNSIRNRPWTSKEVKIFHSDFIHSQSQSFLQKSREHLQADKQGNQERFRKQLILFQNKVDPGLYSGTLCVNSVSVFPAVVSQWVSCRLLHKIPYTVSRIVES